MIRQSSKPQGLSFAQTMVPSSDSSTIPKIGSMPAGRLLVLVPDDLAFGITTRRIWELAVTTGRHVQLPGLCKKMVQEHSLHRQSVTLSALIAASGVPTEAKVEIGRNWLGAVKRNYQTGDMIVCFAEEYTGLWQRSLREILESNLDTPIYILSGFHYRMPARSNVLSLVLFWVGIVSIIIGALLLQIPILSLPREWVSTTLLILVVIAEFWLIWVWNQLFS